METTTLVTDLLSLFSIENGLFVMFAIFGMFAHAIKKYLAGQLKGTVADYLFFNNPKRSMLALFTTLGACASLILGAQIPEQAGAFLMLAVTTGFTADSTVNKDE